MVEQDAHDPLFSIFALHIAAKTHDHVERPGLALERNVLESASERTVEG